MAKAKIEETKDSTSVRNFTDLIRHIENTLGWAPNWDDPRPAYKIRAIEAGKLKKICQRNPKLYTLENLLVAVEYLRRRKQEVTAPAGVCFVVERALEEVQREDEISDLEAQRERALTEAMSLPGPDRDRWVRQLSRANGAPLAELIKEWNER